MRSFIAATTLVCASAINAKCVQYPPLLVEIEVSSCQAFAVKSTTALSSWELLDEGEEFPIHSPGEEHGAALLSGTVVSAMYVSTEPGKVMPFEAAPYVSLGLAHLELDGEPAAVCPRKLPATIAVVGNPRCCDTLPSQGACISPFVRVRVEPNPSRWHKLGANADNG